MEGRRTEDERRKEGEKKESAPSEVILIFRQVNNLWKLHTSVISLRIIRLNKLQKRGK